MSEGIDKKHGVSVYERAAEDEPLFIIRAQDVLGPEVVREWAYRAQHLGVADDKVAAARRCADAMEDWQIKNTKKVPD